MDMQIPNMVVCLEHFYTLRYNTFFHIFLCLTTYQKLVVYAGIPLKQALSVCKVILIDALLRDL